MPSLIGKWPKARAYTNISQFNHLSFNFILSPSGLPCEIKHYVSYVQADALIKENYLKKQTSHSVFLLHMWSTMYGSIELTGNVFADMWMEYSFLYFLQERSQ